MAPGPMSPQPISSGPGGTSPITYLKLRCRAGSTPGLPASKPGSSQAAPTSDRVIP